MVSATTPTEFFSGTTLSTPGTFSAAASSTCSGVPPSTGVRSTVA